MRKFFLCNLALALISLSLIACVTYPVKPEEIKNADYSISEIYKEAIQGYMSKKLFDPYSAVYRFYDPIKGYAHVHGKGNPPEFGYLVQVGINAKNRMGGYVGEENYSFLFKNEKFWELNPYIVREVVSLPEEPDKKKKATSSSESTAPSLTNSSQIDLKSNISPNEKGAVEGKVNEETMAQGEIVKKEGERLILELSGNGMTQTRPFTVDGEWEVYWESEGSLFQLMVYKMDNSSDSNINTINSLLPNYLANTMAPGKGNSYVPEGGKYRFTVNAIGTWKLKVFRIDTTQ